MIEEYIPIELWKESKNFIQDITDNVEIYKKIRSFGSIKINEEAERFLAWWEFKRYSDFPHSLVLLYENVNEIEETVGESQVMDAFYQLQLKLILYYRLLKEKGFINE